MERLCVAKIVGVHGVRGLVKVKSFTDDPEAFVSYGPLVDERGGGPYGLSVRGQNKGVLICAVDGVSDRTAAEALKSVSLYCDRSTLPADLLDEDEFYHADLIGLSVIGLDGAELGHVHALHDFGAGDMLEVRLTNAPRTVMLPFTKAVVPKVDMAAGVLSVDPPAGLLPGSDGAVEDADGVLPEAEGAA